MCSIRRRRTAPAAAILALFVAFAGAACTGEAPAPEGALASAADGAAGPIFAVDEPAPAATFDEVFEVVDRITLEETNEVVTVQPFVSMDEDGRFLLAETREAQVRVYAPDGRLERVLGRRGQGPGELMTPVSAQVAGDGRVVVSDPSLGRITVYPASGDAEPEILSSPVTMASDVRAMPSGGYLVVGHDPNRSGEPLLHRWDGRSDEAESFFPMPLPVEDRPLALSVAWTHTALSGDTIWAVFSLSDTIFRFGPDGEDRGRIVVPMARPPTVPRPRGNTPAELIEEMGSGAHLFNLFLLGDGTLAVQTARTRGAAVDFGVVLLERDGRGIAEVAEAPRLMGVRGDRYYFQDPESLLPNEWVVAVRRRAS